MMFRMLIIVIMILLPTTISFAGFFDLFTPRFQEGIVKEKVLQMDVVKKKLENCGDIFCFADNVYQIKKVKSKSIRSQGIHA